LKPTSSRNPPTGTLALPVTNCNNCGSRILSSGVAAHLRTVCQNHLTWQLSLESPDAQTECLSQSSTSMSRMPLNNWVHSTGDRSAFISCCTECGTTVERPRLTAATWSSMPCRVLQHLRHSAYCALFSSVTMAGPSDAPRATSALPTSLRGSPGQTKRLPGRRSSKRTRAGKGVAAVELDDMEL